MNKTKYFLTAALIFVHINPFSSFAQDDTENKKSLTYGQAYKREKPKLIGRLPDIRGWLDDSHYLEYRDEDDEVQLLKIHARNGKEEVFLDYGKLNENLPAGFSLQASVDRTDDYNIYIFNKDGNIYSYDRSKDDFRQLTAAKSRAKNPTLSPDGKYAAYTRNHDLYVMNIETGLEKQLTSDGSDVTYNGWASWVYYEEILGRSSNYRAFWWSPDSEKIAFLRFDDSPVPLFKIFDADGIHGNVETMRYPKPGDPNPKVDLKIAKIESGKIIDVENGSADNDYTAFPKWIPGSDELIFQRLNRDQDTLHIYKVFSEKGKSEIIYEEISDTWVDFFNDLYIFKDGSGFLIPSYKSGWQHIYYYDFSGGMKDQLTHGMHSVNNIAHVDEKNLAVYFHSGKENSTSRHLYKTELFKMETTQLTEGEGWHSCDVSPNGRYFIDEYSNLNTPKIVNLHKSDGEKIRTIADSKTKEFEKYDLGRGKLFTIPSGDGYDLPALWILPPNFDQQKKYPVIMKIYGGPGHGTVKNRFRNRRGLLADYYLAQHGIIVMSVDHRGSGHLGKTGMDEMHRNLGKWEMHDYTAASKWLKQQSFIDTGKIGISGGSYGGYVVCMALTYGSDHFTHGIAKYSVTDWRLYDNVYTERYMDTPEDNPEGYGFANTMNYIHQYKGGLYIMHGIMDDNVHMQNTLQFIDKMQIMDKDFELMLYPNERHGIHPPRYDHSARESVQFWFRNFLGKETVE